MSMDGSTLMALFSSSFLAATLLPGGSEAVFAYAHYQAVAAPWLLWAVATCGNTLGGFTSWGIGCWIRRLRPLRELEKAPHREALQRIRRHGTPLLLLSWLPVVGDPLCLAAGWSGIRALPALLYIALGKGIRYALLLGVLLSAV